MALKASTRYEGCSQHFKESLKRPHMSYSLNSFERVIQGIILLERSILEHIKEDTTSFNHGSYKGDQN